MSPMTLLRLWRERWGMLDVQSPGEPYALASRKQPWGSGMTHASLWTTRGVSLCVLLLAIPLFAAATLVPADLSGQWLFAVVLLAMAFYVRRYMGTLAFLVLVGLTMLAGARYLAWRWNATIPPAAGAPLIEVLGWTLWLAESVALAALVLWLVGRLVSVARPSTALADVIDEWPYVDVLVVAGQSGTDQAIEVMRTAQTQTWPADHLRWFLQDAGGIREWRRDGRDAAPAAKPVALSLPDANGAFILRIEADGPNAQLDDPMLLQNWVVWMQRDPHLAMLGGHRSPLAAAPSQQARALVQDAPGAAVTLLRRAAVAEFLNEPMTSDPAMTVATLAERLAARGLRSALMGLATEASTGTALPAGWLRVDMPDDAASLRRRMRLSGLLQIMHRPARLALYTMAAAALALPAFGLLLVDTHLPWFLAYALPYASLAFLTWLRTLTPRRRPVSDELKDWGLALVLPLFTALHALLEARRRRRSLRQGRWSHNALWNWLCLAVVLIGLLRLSGAAPVMRPWLALACIGVGYFMLLRVSKWAVDEELSTLRSAHAKTCVQAASLRLEDASASAHTSTGASAIELNVEIVNFPEQPLRFSIVTRNATLAEGAAVMQLRCAPGVVLAGQFRLDATADDRSAHACFVPDESAAARLLTIAEHMQMSYLKRHYWLPGSRLFASLRRSSPRQSEAQAGAQTGAQIGTQVEAHVEAPIETSIETQVEPSIETHASHAPHASQYTFNRSSL